MNMLKMRFIGSAALFLGAVACTPLPVYQPSDAHRRPYPPRQPDQRDQRDQLSPYYGNELTQSPQNTRSDDDDSRRGQPPPPVERVPRRDDYPIAERTDNPNQVISPYGPDYNVIDVEGFRSGQLAKDPSNGKIFRIP